jgi:hypothetical protein
MKAITVRVFIQTDFMYNVSMLLSGKQLLFYSLLL